MLLVEAFPFVVCMFSLWPLLYAFGSRYVPECILGNLYLYVFQLISQSSSSSCNFRSPKTYLLYDPSILTEMRRKAFVRSFPHTWNSLRREIKLKTLVPFTQSKAFVNSTVNDFSQILAQFSFLNTGSFSVPTIFLQPPYNYF